MVRVQAERFKQKRKAGLHAAWGKKNGHGDPNERPYQKAIPA